LIDVQGGLVGDIVTDWSPENVQPNASLSVSGGTIGNISSSASGVSWNSVLISGGEITGVLEWAGDGEITGGSVNRFAVSGNSGDYGMSLVISGGTFQDMNFSTSSGHSNPPPDTVIVGGTFLGSFEYGSSMTHGGSLVIGGGTFLLGAVFSYGDYEINGGAFLGGTIYSQHGTLTIRGGSIQSSLVPFSQTVLYVVGSGFNYPLGAIPDASGVLTGVLADGSPIDTSFSIHPGDGHRLVLVPEPSTGLLLGFGLFAMRCSRR
jgi:hypothetical protein